MARAFLPLSTLDDLDQALVDSETRLIVLFKHSLTCGSSSRAESQLLELLADDLVPAEIYRVSVQTARPVVLAIAERLGVRHESPQVLIVSKGAVLWHGSHFRITTAAVRAQLEPRATAV